MIAIRTKSRFPASDMGPSGFSPDFRASDFRAPRRAFTLIELILVLVILAIVAAAVAPSLRAFGVGRSNQDAATMVLAMADYARTQAASEGRPYRLNVDPQKGTIWLTVQDNGIFDAPTSNDFGKPFSIPDGSRITTDMPQRTDGCYSEFQPGGRVEPAKIDITDKLGNQVEIAAASATELFRILPQNGGAR